MDISKLTPLLACKEFLDCCHFSDMWIEDDEEILVIELLVQDEHKHLVTDQTMETICAALGNFLEVSIGISIIYAYTVH